MIDIEKQINDIRELLYEKYNKEKFMNFIAQKENQLLIHTFMQFLYDDIHKFKCLDDLDEHVEMVFEKASKTLDVDHY